GTRMPNPALVSAGLAPASNFQARIPLRYLVSPVGENGRPDPSSTNFIRSGGSIIARENGKRFIAVKFSVRDSDLASTVEKVRHEIKPLYEAPYRAQMGGEFEQMNDAEMRLLLIVP